MGPSLDLELDEILYINLYYIIYKRNQRERTKQRQAPAAGRAADDRRGWRGKTRYRDRIAHRCVPLAVRARAAPQSPFKEYHTSVYEGGVCDTIWSPRIIWHGQRLFT